MSNSVNWSLPAHLTYFVIVAKTACLVALVKGPSKFPINFDVVSLQSRFDVNCVQCSWSAIAATALSFRCANAAAAATACATEQTQPPGILTIHLLKASEPRMQN